jgi:thioredoxin-dependent peroxiredoxin
MLAAGTRAPEFSLPDQDGKEVSLSSLLGQRMLVLYFYPADFTIGCTREACALRDMHPELLESGFAVAGVSPQSPERHKAFREKYALPFTLLSDSHKAVIKMYQVNGLLGLGVRRATFLIDRGRTIRDAVLADFKIAKHTELIRNALALGIGGR